MEQNFSEHIDSKPYKNSQRLKFGVLGLFLAGLFLLALGGGLFLFKGSRAEGDVEIISSTSSARSETMLVVHVDGAVAVPGIYHLPVGSRVNDALLVAGGLSSDADRAKINLAAKVSDGQKIYIQRIGESVSLPAGQAGQSVSGSVGQTVGASVSQLVNINTASEAELDGLPGIGPVTAGKIIASRPYSAAEELLSKKVVSSSVWQKIKELITL